MKLRILSDLHIDYNNFNLKPLRPEENILVIAGDISNNFNQSTDLIKNYMKICEADVIFVLGKHDYYGDSINGTIIKWVAFQENNPKFHLLQDTSITLHGYRFCGATLWSELAGHHDLYTKVSENIQDYKNIYVTDNVFISPRETQLIHLNSKFIIDKTIQLSKEPVIVVTHFLPSKKSVADEYKNMLTSVFYYSEMDKLVGHPNVKMWIHGNTHMSMSYKIEDTYVICNPRGYSGNNHRFNPSLYYLL